MKNINYSVKRDDIHVGFLVFYDNAKIANLRRIYFTLNENKEAKDLLYDVNYPLANSKDGLFINQDNIYNIGLLLKYLGFGEYLTFDDILKIDNIFKYGWKYDNANLFGVYQALKDDEVAYVSIDHRYPKFMRYVKDSMGSPIPQNLFDKILEYGNKWDVKNNQEIDFALLSSKEGNVRKLTR